MQRWLAAVILRANCPTVIGRCVSLSLLGRSVRRCRVSTKSLIFRENGNAGAPCSVASSCVAVGTCCKHTTCQNSKLYEQDMIWWRESQRGMGIDIHVYGYWAMLTDCQQMAEIHWIMNADIGKWEKAKMCQHRRTGQFFLGGLKKFARKIFDSARKKLLC